MEQMGGSRGICPYTCLCCPYTGECLVPACSQIRRDACYCNMSTSDRAGSSSEGLIATLPIS